MPPPVVNANEIRDGLYIGRRFGGYEASHWANPFLVGKDTEENRKTAIWKYVLHILDSPMRFHLDQLRQADRLICWCAPKLCHGHVLQWIMEHQQFRAPCNKCGEPLLSKMNIHKHDLGPNRALVYEQGECHNPKCRHYRFTHTAYIEPDTIPDWVAARRAEHHG